MWNMWNMWNGHTTTPIRRELYKKDLAAAIAAIGRAHHTPLDVDTVAQVLEQLGIRVIMQCGGK